MKKLSKRKKTRNPFSGFSVKLKMFFILLFCSNIVFGQELMELGKLDLVKAPTHVTIAQRSIIPSKANINTFRFRTTIGGVAFEEVAYPSNNLIGKNVSIDYFSSNNQIVISIGNQHFYERLPKWQLQPITNFVNSGDKAIITVFGDNIAQVKYHPVFLDNLLGLRLFQADLMLAGAIWDLADAWEIPKNKSTGRFIYAKSEESLLPDVFNNEKYVNIYRKIERILYDFDYESYVFTDWNQSITFDVVNNKFILNGEPYYSFTKIGHEINWADFEEQTSEYIKSLDKEFCLIKLQDPYSILKVEKPVDNDLFKILKDTLGGFLSVKLARPIKIDLSLGRNIDENETIQKGIYIKSQLDKYWNPRDSAKYVSGRINFLNQLKIILDQSINENHITQNSTSDFAKNILTLHEYCKNENIEITPYIFYEIKRLNYLYPDSKYVTYKKLNKACLDYYVENTTLDLCYRISYFYLLSKEVILQDDLILSFKQNWNLLYSYNPVVYDAALKTMQWSAFFRYVKDNNPDNWNSFVSKINKLTINDAPGVYTPINYVFRTSK